MTAEKKFSVSPFKAFKEQADKLGFRTFTDDEDFQKYGKSHILLESKKFRSSLEIRATKKYGSNVATVEIGWSSAGTPRPSLAEAEQFGLEVIKATKVAAKLKALKEIPLKK